MEPLQAPAAYLSQLWNTRSDDLNPQQIAVHIAVSWWSADQSTPLGRAYRDAARIIAERQTLYRNCAQCGCPLVPDLTHTCIDGKIVPFTSPASTRPGRTEFGMGTWKGG